MLKRLLAYSRLYVGPEADYRRHIFLLTGFAPFTTAHYRLAFRHASAVANPGPGRLSSECNERLEFLGDAVLGTVVAEYLYRRYPNRNEGWLTEMRAKIVKRKTLNHLGEQLGLDQLLEYNKRGGGLHSSLMGNTLEAFIGAIYMDRGQNAARSFVLKRLLHPHIDIETLEEVNDNYKSQLMEFVQKQKLPPITYELVAEEVHHDKKRFTIVAKMGNEVLGEGVDTRKKAAEQRASEMALRKLNLLEPA